MTGAIAGALVHSLWQLSLIALVVAVVAHGWSVRAQYAMHVLGLLVGLCWFGATAAAVPSGGVSVGAAPAWMGFVVLAWSCGVAVFGLRVFVGLATLWFAWARSREASQKWRARMNQLAAAMGVKRPVRLRSSHRVDQPMTAGWLRPVILVPATLWTRLPEDYIEALLAHELAHIRRHDFAIHVLQSLIEAVFFFHPAVWWMSSRARTLREYCCDDVAVAVLQQPKSYVRALTELESLRPTFQQLALGAIPTRGGQLMKRFQRLLTPRPTRPRFVSALLSIALLLAVLLTTATNRAEMSPPTWLPPTVQAWWPDITEAAAKHGVDPRLVATVMLMESGGDELAVSSSGAVGLMQVMPKTGASIARERGIDAADYDLSDPATNIDFGAWYLAQQLDAFGDDPHTAAAAYNGGPRAVRRAKFSDETKRYVALFTNLWSQPEATLGDWRERVRLRWQEGAVHPLTDTRHKVSAAFGTWNKHPVTGERADHDGVDWLAEAGSPVYAPVRGWVVAAERRKVAGNTVIIRHPGGIETRYYHLQDYEVAAGDAIEAGAQIGSVGSTGASTGPHLHFEIRDLGTPVDPTTYTE